jgi:hypothetical protein
VIFTEGIAAALVGSALQLGEHQRLLLAASVLFGLGFIGTFAVLFLDRFTVVDERKIIQDARTRGLDARHLLEELRVHDWVSMRNNDTVVAQMRIAANVQAVIAVAATVLAVLSMLLPA